jgi:hypothetical protein
MRIWGVVEGTFIIQLHEFRKARASKMIGFFFIIIFLENPKKSLPPTQKLFQFKIHLIKYKI